MASDTAKKLLKKQSQQRFQRPGTVEERGKCRAEVPSAHCWAFPTASKTLFASLRVALVAILGFALTACVDDDKSDLEAYVAKIRAQKTPFIDDLPQFPTDVIYIYPSGDRRDPFESFEKADEQFAMRDTIEESTQEQKLCLRPDAHRNREALEKHPLDSLKMVGTLKPKGEPLSALVVDNSPETLLYTVYVGNYMGQNHGRVMSIDENQIMLMEMVPDGQGCYEEREAIVKLQK
jgi:type IV pilus assembly protein PilP